MKRVVTSKRETTKALIHKRDKPPMTHPICPPLPPVPLQAVPAVAAKMHLAVGWPLAAHTAPPAVVPACVFAAAAVRPPPAPLQRRAVRTWLQHQALRDASHTTPPHATRHAPRHPPRRTPRHAARHATPRRYLVRFSHALHSALSPRSCSVFVQLVKHSPLHCPSLSLLPPLSPSPCPDPRRL